MEIKEILMFSAIKIFITGLPPDVEDNKSIKIQKILLG